MNAVNQIVSQIVIVGGGVGAAAAAEMLRSEGFEGRIIQISDETSLPYDRPPLSKGYLSGEMALGDILLHAEDWYTEHKVTLKLGQAVASINIAENAVVLENGERVAYDRLLLANGARARLLPGIPPQLSDKVHYVRTTQDADRIRALAGGGSGGDNNGGKRAVMIGGGVIGIETAATLKLLGCDVTVLEMAPRIMARFFPPELSQLLESVHTAKGVNILTGIGIESIKEKDGAARVSLKDGREFLADLLVVGIGVVPNSELGAEAGLETHLQGIKVNGVGQTSSPAIYAVGDVAAFPLPDGNWTRWENWTHARNHAAVAVKHMLGKDTAHYADTPWIWSDQYDFNIQVTGSPEAEQVVMRGSLDSGRLTAFHLKQGRVVGATTINDSRNKASIRKLIERDASLPFLSVEQLADTSADLKKLVASL
jgi:3-phenylpropionate/trans-cinnamate dioxygenase ferredoxin reductase component